MILRSWIYGMHVLHMLVATYNKQSNTDSVAEAQLKAMCMLSDVPSILLKVHFVHGESIATRELVIFEPQLSSQLQRHFLLLV